MKTPTLFLSILMSIQLFACGETEVISSTSSNIAGNWTLKSVFLSDATDTPCAADAKNTNDLTFTLTQDTKDSKKFTINGKSAVNTYFGSMQVTGINANGWTITMDAIGSTKMAGSPALMDCESRFFTLLQGAKEMRILDGNLQLGNFKQPNSSPRDGGTYLTFAKK